MTSTSRRAGLATALIVAGAVGISSPAWAGTKGLATSGSQKLTSASWGAVGTTTGGSAQTGSPLTLTWQGLGVTTQYIDVDNTGSLDLTGETYTTTNSALQILGGTAPTVTLTGCVGAAWNTSSGKCTGTQVALGTSATGATTATTPIATNGSLSVRAATTTSLLGWTTTVSVSTDRSEVRAGTTTTS